MGTNNGAVDMHDNNDLLSTKRVLPDTSFIMETNGESYVVTYEWDLARGAKSKGFVNNSIKAVLENHLNSMRTFNDLENGDLIKPDEFKWTSYFINYKVRANEEGKRETFYEDENAARLWLRYVIDFCTFIPVKFFDPYDDSISENVPRIRVAVHVKETEEDGQPIIEENYGVKEYEERKRKMEQEEKPPTVNLSRLGQKRSGPYYEKGKNVGRIFLILATIFFVIYMLEIFVVM